MNRVRSIAQAVFGLLIIVGSAFGVITGLRWVLTSLFHGLNPTIAAAMVAGSVTLFGSVFTVVYSRAHERRKTIEAEIRAAKLPVYTKFIRGMLEGLFLDETTKPGRNSKAITRSDHLAKVMRDSTPDMVVWASDDVLREWSHFRNSAGSLTHQEFLAQFESLLKAFRRDYGHKNQGLDLGIISGTFLNDVQALLLPQPVDDDASTLDTVTIPEARPRPKIV